MTQATSSVDGYLSHIDWATFNGKQNALGLAAGTYTNGDMCTYASSGTLLNCNTAIPTVGTWGALNYPTYTSLSFVKMTAAGTFALDTNTYMPTTGGTFTGGISAPSVTASGLTSGNCVQAMTGGLLTTTSGPCGTSSGTLTATGSPSSGQIAQFSGPTSLTTATSANMQSAIGSGVYDASGAAAARAAVGSCTTGQYGTATTTSGLTCAQVAYSQLSGTPTIAATTNLLQGNGSGGASSSGIAASNVPLLNAANTFTATNTFNNGTYSALFTGGNVGIGTTTPAYQLDVQGTTPRVRISTPNFGGLEVDNTNSSSLARNWGIVNDQVNTGDLSINQSTTKGGDPFAGTSIMYFSGTNGNVGIGTTSPSALLSVGSGSPFQVSSVGVSQAAAGSSDYSTTSSAQEAHCLADGANCPSNGIFGLTSGYIPLAGSATTLTGNSHLDDGVTTSGKITATEPIAMPTGSTVNSKNICLTDGTNCPSGILFLGNSSWTIAPTLFATSTMLGAVHYTPYSNAAGPTITVRTSGTISCTVAPVLQLMDLGTTPSTVYASATSILSVTTSTSDGVFTAIGSSALQNNHYYGIAFSAGTCATAPTFDASVSAVW